MSIDQKDNLDLARRIAFLLHQEERKIFGENLGGSFEQLVNRLLSASGSVDPTVYELAFNLRFRARK